MNRQGTLYATAIVAALVLTPLTLLVGTNLATPQLVDFDVRPHVLCVSLVLFSCVSYLAWPSRWNVLAHTQLVFSVVAYVIPIYFLRVIDSLPEDALDLYYKVAGVGLAFAVIGVLAGRAAGTQNRAERLRRRSPLGDPKHEEMMRRRVWIFAWASIAGIAVSFAVMGFIPAFAPDPLTAKFFRGAYAAAYAPVAPLYRASTSVIAVLLPLVAYYAFVRKETSWRLAFLGCLAAMLVGLQREPAVTGVLVLIGVALAATRRPLWIYFAVLFGAYFAGGALYSILETVGLSGFATTESTAGQAGFLAQVSGGAPDIRDQVTFMQAWIANDPGYTLGRTFFGGLIPGNYEWNTSVWSLTVVNPGVPIDQIASGGLRLTPAMWGLASFGWLGVAIVSFFYGYLSGLISRIAARIIPLLPIRDALPWMALYLAAMEVLPNFFRLSYLSVGQLLLIAFLVMSTKPILTRRTEASSGSRRSSSLAPR